MESLRRIHNSHQWNEHPEEKAAKSVISCQVPSQPQKRAENAGSYAPDHRVRQEAVPVNMRCCPGGIIQVCRQKFPLGQFCHVISDHCHDQGCGGQNGGIHPGFSRETNTEGQCGPGPSSRKDEACHMRNRATEGGKKRSERPEHCARCQRGRRRKDMGSRREHDVREVLFDEQAEEPST